MRLPLFKRAFSGGAYTNAAWGGFDNSLTVDDASGDPRLIFSGPWQIEIVSGAFDETISTSGSTNDSVVTFTFVGTAVAVVGSIPANMIPTGSSYTLDDMFIGNYPGSPVSMYESNVTFFSVNSLDPSEHTLQITLIPGDAPFMLDYVAYQPLSSNPLDTSTSSMSSSVMMSAETSSTAMSTTTSSSAPISSSSTASATVSSASTTQTTAGSSATPTVARSNVVHTSQIAGGVVSGLVILFLLVFILLRCCKRKGWGFYKTDSPGSFGPSSEAGSSAESVKELRAGDSGIIAQVPISISAPQPSNVQFPLPTLQSDAVRTAYAQQPEAGPSFKPLPPLPPRSPFSVSSPRVQRALLSPPNSARGRHFRFPRKSPVSEEAVMPNLVVLAGNVGLETSASASTSRGSQNPRAQSFNPGKPSSSTPPLRRQSSRI